MTTLGVNIDHVATVRQARNATQPDPVWAAALAQLGGADCITVHLREDRRHIQLRDVEILRQTVSVKLNLECACDPEVLDIACRITPDQVCLVPERREELTTEGGLAVVGNEEVVEAAIQQLATAGIRVSLFIDAQADQITAAAGLGANIVEIHTGQYSMQSGENRAKELSKIALAADYAHRAELEVHAGHGLDYQNVIPVAAIAHISELNIGHSIVGRALYVGMQAAVREMKDLLERADRSTA
jgi:pyridoxine 5-phosphate synthase